MILSDLHPAVSVIMNVRNGGRYLREAIDSVLAQTFSDWELIFWDDHSTDTSASIAGSYHDLRIRYFFSPEDRSLGRARHLAMAEAKGEWIAFLDQDDVWLPTKLERQMEIAAEDSATGIVYGRAVAFTQRGRERDYDHRHEFKPLPENDIFLRLFSEPCFICMSAVMFRRRLCVEIGGIPEPIHCIPDHYLLVAVGQKCRARAVQDVVCRYRLHDSNMLWTHGRAMQEETLWLIDQWANVLSDAQLVSSRRKVHHTMLALQEMRRLRTLLSGTKRLMTQGSLSFLLSRPFVITVRALRRRLKQPYWKNPPPPRREYRPEVLRDEIDLSVIIVTYNAERLIENCLNSLFEECRDLKLEVFVVDSGSADNTVNLVRERFPTVRLHASPLNIGFSAGNNIAISKARGRYVALLNPDTIVHKGAFKCLMLYLDQHPRVGGVGPTLRLGNGEIQVECARNLPRIGNLFPWLLLLDKLEWTLRFRQHPKDTGSPPRKTMCDRYSLLSWPRDRTCEVESICGACMVIRREVIQQIGGLDETTPLYLDDIDYCRRIREAGWSIHYVAQATITHLWKQSSSSFERAGDFYAMGMHSIWLYLRKHDGRFASMAFSIMACVASPIRVLISAAASAISGGQRKLFWERQLNMALGLSRWAFRLPKTAPRFGFASETRTNGSGWQVRDLSS